MVHIMDFSGGSDGQQSACNARDPGSIPCWKDPLEKGMATHSSILAWRIPWTEEPGRLESMGLQRVRHDLVTFTHSLIHGPKRESDLFIGQYTQFWQKPKGKYWWTFKANWNVIYEKALCVWYMQKVSHLWLRYLSIYKFSPDQFNHSVVSNSLRPHESQHARPPCPSPTPVVHPDSSPSSQWCHPAISSSVLPFSSCPQSFPASGSFQMSQLFASGGQSIGVSASTSLLPMNTQDWCPLGWTGWISLQSKGLSRVFSNTTVQKHQFFGAQLSL